MKRLLTTFTLAVTLSAALSMAAQEPLKKDNPPRFAFFTLGLLVENSSKAKKIFAELETTQKSLNDKLKGKAEEGQKIQQQLQGGSLSDQGRDLLKKQLRDIEFEYKKLQEDSQSEFAKVQQKVLGQIYNMAGPIINDVAKEQKLQVVLSGDSAQAQQLVQWADEEWIRAFSLEVAKRLDSSEVVPTMNKPAAKPTIVPPATKPVVKKP